ncbi:ATP-binding protein [Neobacillus kokaensis]|uniref:histidine kinase n=1 Tax=Neobacillus kokaensis TaxID=2759023 RepID=A0ABQ3N3B1_9BACI|nr:ATP-binding protein [Neobacillus kokaensis]GHH98052.1 hypothetical protein AM1BK_15950 [Neobacillus kokaensis]
MKRPKHLKTSLTKQFSMLMITIIVAFSLLMTALLIYQNQIQKQFETTNKQLQQKQLYASELNYAFNLAISEMRAYFAFNGEPSFYKEVVEQQHIVKDRLTALKALADDDDDRRFINHAEDFYNYYFYDAMPRSKALYDAAGKLEEITGIAVTQKGSQTIREYQSNLKSYTDTLKQHNIELHDEQDDKIILSQLVCAVILLLLISGMGLLTRYMLGKIGRPLKNLTMAASEIAKGHTIVFTDAANRQDELGLLSRAFEKMSKSIQEKEHDLRKLYEQAEEERLLTQNILDTINEGIQLIDTTGQVIQVNQKLCDLSGINSSAIIHKNYEEWCAALIKIVENEDELKRFFDQVVIAQETIQSSTIYHQHSPAKRVVRVYCEALTRDGEKIGTVIVHRDITKEYEVDVMKSEFVSTVSHELRTPLASVLGFTELMLNKELKPVRQKKYLTTIYQEARRLTALINDFLDVQRMESGKQTYEKKYEDVIPILQPIIEAYEVNHPQHVIHFEAKTSHTVVFGDKDKLSQVFNNLISNAIKYSPGGGNIFVTVFEEASSLKIAIKDEGLGIPADALDKLFTKFYRVDNSDRRKIGGTGLGLAIVKEIVKAHDGDVSVSSAPQEGSLFTVRFPLVTGITRSTKDIQPEPVQHQTGKFTVIIVEDDLSHASLLHTELEESNFHVKVFSTGEAALASIEANHPDVIVLDIMLGENVMDGWEFIKQVKAIEDLKTIPIFISSALDDKEKGKALGANEYLIKPYQPSKLSNIIFQTLLQKDRTGQIHIPSEES